MMCVVGQGGGGGDCFSKSFLSLVHIVCRWFSLLASHEKILYGVWATLKK